MAILKKQAIPPERLCIWKKRVQAEQKGKEFQELNLEQTNVSIHELQVDMKNFAAGNTSNCHK